MRIAIVGGGVSGLVTAHLLRERHEVTVIEADDRIGGHVHTWDVHAGTRTLGIDSGFIVYNERNYPHFSRLLRELEVPTQPSTMSFSVRCDVDGIEYNGSTPRQLFVQKRNLARPAFLQMVTDIVRFNRGAVRWVRGGDAEMSLGALLEREGFSRAFREWYLLPMGSAIWSLPARRVLAMPAAFFVEFFHNHGMLTIDDRPQWRVVQGGSRNYVDRLIAPFRSSIRTGHRVRSIARFHDHVEVDGERFDAVVLACHSDQALSLLSDPSAQEREVLTALPYQRNEALLHTDTSILPRAKKAWGAWNYRVLDDDGAPALVTYDMNILQSIESDTTYCVTLNGEAYVDPATILGRVTYDHPAFGPDSSAARARRRDVSGVNRTHYCGAYWGNGFHEDGVVSAMVVASEIDAFAHRQAAQLARR